VSHQQFKLPQQVALRCSRGSECERVRGHGRNQPCQVVARGLEKRREFRCGRKVSHAEPIAWSAFSVSPAKFRPRRRPPSSPLALQGEERVLGRATPVTRQRYRFSLIATSFLPRSIGEPTNASTSCSSSFHSAGSRFAVSAFQRSSVGQKGSLVLGRKVAECSDDFNGQAASAKSDFTVVDRSLRALSRWRRAMLSCQPFSLTRKREFPPASRVNCEKDLYCRSRAYVVASPDPGRVNRGR